jgi:TCP-1/cpn60 chaperonin family
VYGGGAAEIACGLAVDKAADASPGLEQYAMHAFAESLDVVPMALAENAGLSPIETLAAIKSKQVREGNSRLGVDAMGTGSYGELDVCVPGWNGTANAPETCASTLSSTRSSASASNCCWRRSCAAWC